MSAIQGGHFFLEPELGINIVDLGLVYGINTDEDNNVLKNTYKSRKCRND
jgi:metal-sulfur cluster biosynthetic enzyme